MLDLINVKFPEKKIGENLCGFGLGKDFLIITKSIFKKTNKLNFVKTKKHFAPSKDSVNYVEKISEKYVSDKGNLSRIHKEFF